MCEINDLLLNVVAAVVFVIIAVVVVVVVDVVVVVFIAFVGVDLIVLTIFNATVVGSSSGDHGVCGCLFFMVV